jgi:hypothetical protein
VQYFGRVARAGGHVDGGWNSGADRCETKRRAETTRLEQWRIDSLGKVRRLVQGELHVAPDVPQDGLCCDWIGLEQRGCELDADRDCYQVLLHPLVEVTFEPLAIGIAGQNKTSA